MPLFTYHVRDRHGRSTSGQTEAASVSDLAARLRAEGMMVLAIEPVDSADTQKAGWARWHPARLLPITSLDVELGLRQMVSMLRSGVSILTALKTTGEQSSRPRALAMWLRLEECIRSGATLSDAMRQSGKHFDNYVVQLVHVGEHSGEMDVALTYAAEHLELHRHVRVTVANALIYPCLATLMAVGVSVYLLVGVIPKISVFLESGGARLPAMTQMLVDLSGWLRLNGGMILIGLAALVAIWWTVRRYPDGRETQDAFLLRLPVVGRVLRLSATAVFARSLSMLLESGVTLLDALGAVEQLLGNRRLARRVARARDGVMRGNSLADMLKQAPEFLPHLASMTAVAETSGLLAPTLSEVARFHESLLMVAIKRFSILLEPLMILVTGGIIGFVYTAFFVALFEMATTI